MAATSRETLTADFLMVFFFFLRKAYITIDFPPHFNGAKKSFFLLQKPNLAALLEILFKPLPHPDIPCFCEECFPGFVKLLVCWINPVAPIWTTVLFHQLANPILTYLLTYFNLIYCLNVTYGFEGKTRAWKRDCKVFFNGVWGSQFSPLFFYPPHR